MLDVSIVIPTLNRLDSLVPCIESIHRHTSVGYEIIVYANCCTRETAAYLRSVRHVQAMIDNDNRYFTEAVNRAIAQAQGRYVFLLNDDCAVLRPDWFAFYHGLLRLDRRIAMVGPYWKNVDELPYGWIEPYATLYPRRIFERFGPLPDFDESFVLWWSDIYHAYQLMAAGYQLLPLHREVVDAFVRHRRVGESGETVLSVKAHLPKECFTFHGRDLMYRRLGITDDRMLAGYFGGKVWGRDAIRPLFADQQSDGSPETVSAAGLQSPS
ncbi:MAG: glycosyltransferase [Candidatus Binatia bacterium]